jgi:hypothetical protein
MVKMRSFEYVREGGVRGEEQDGQGLESREK